MTLLAASLPALVAIFLFVGTVRLKRAPRRAAATVTPLPLPNAAALARALTEVEIHDGDRPSRHAA